MKIMRIESDQSSPRRALIMMITLQIERKIYLDLFLLQSVDLNFIENIGISQTSSIDRMNDNTGINQTVFKIGSSV